MAEYWNAKDGFKLRAENYIKTLPEPDLFMSYNITAKDFVNAGKASSEVKKMLKKLGVDSKILRRTAIASYEGEINVAAHSKGGVMKCNIFEDLVHVQFTDKGPGMKDIYQAMVPGWSTADDLTRRMGFGAGLGLPNIENNSDALRIISAEGESTTMEFLIFFN
ncbi:MAG: ATP-binding protein [Candidatus Cloacimonadota bacterium]|nr:MAG: ATP-binding protein [Candidatus Cloacimonadota bacterium]